MNRAIEAKATEKDRAIDAYRHSVIELPDLEEQLGRVQTELEPLQAELTQLMNETMRTGQSVGKITSAEGLLKELQGALQSGLDWETKQEIVNILVNRITVVTSGTGQSKTATIEVLYEFGEVRQSRAGLSVG